MPINQEYYFYSKPQKISYHIHNQPQTVTINENIRYYSPVIVKNEESYLRYVSFYNESLNRNSLIKKEEVSIKEDGIFYLTYEDVDIIEYNSEKNIKMIENINKNKYKIHGNLLKGDTINIKYRLKNSFTVYQKDENINISLYTEYENVDVIYEGDLESPFKTINRFIVDGKEYHLNINPHFNDIKRGFLYIADKEYPIDKINKKNLNDVIYIRDDIKQDDFKYPIGKIKILDKYNNPVLTNIECRAKKGKAFLYNSKTDNVFQDEHSTDIFGNIYLVYQPGEDNIEDTLTITSNDYKKEINITLEEITTDNNLSMILPNNHSQIITDKDHLLIKGIINNNMVNKEYNNDLTLKIQSYDTSNIYLDKTINNEDINNNNFKYYFYPPTHNTKNQIENLYIELSDGKNNMVQEIQLIGTN